MRVLLIIYSLRTINAKAPVFKDFMVILTSLKGTNAKSAIHPVKHVLEKRIIIALRVSLKHISTNKPSSVVLLVPTQNYLLIKHKYVNLAMPPALIVRD